MDWPALLAFWAAFALALVSPGPNFALMLRIGLGSGRGPALRTTLGIAVGEAVWGFAALFGVAALALRYPVLGTGIRWAGGAFLLWLAFGALRSAWRGAPPSEAGPTAAGGGFWTGLALMLLNAKAGFFWVSLTGVLLGTDLTPAAAFLTVAVCVLLSLALARALGPCVLQLRSDPPLCPRPARDRGRARCRARRPRHPAAGGELAQRRRSRRPCSRCSSIAQASISAGSCVTARKVAPVARTRARSSSITSAPPVASRLAVGSSATTITGSRSRARAMATRCCSPRERSVTLRPAVGTAKPSSSAWARATSAGLGTPAVEPAGHQHVGQDRQARHQVEVLKDEADMAQPPPVALALGQGREVGPGPADGTLPAPARCR